MNEEEQRAEKARWRRGGAKRGKHSTLSVSVRVR